MPRHNGPTVDKQSQKNIVHLVVTPDPIYSYDKLKEALLASHQLTDFQRVELLLAMELLGGGKPSELLADMWEVCPPPATQQHLLCRPLPAAASWCSSSMRTILTSTAQWN